MKNWIKYIITNILLLLFLSSYFHVFSKSTNVDSSYNNKISQKSSENGDLISVSNQSLFVFDTFLEVDEEDFSGLDFFDFSFENNPSQNLCFQFPSELVWKKIDFRNKVLLSLQSKIYIQHCNFRI